MLIFRKAIQLSAARPGNRVIEHNNLSAAEEAGRCSMTSAINSGTGAPISKDSNNSLSTEYSNPLDVANRIPRLPSTAAATPSSRTSTPFASDQPIRPPRSLVTLATHTPEQCSHDVIFDVRVVQTGSVRTGDVLEISFDPSGSDVDAGRTSDAASPATTGRPVELFNTMASAASFRATSPPLSASIAGRERSQSTDAASIPHSSVLKSEHRILLEITTLEPPPGRVQLSLARSIAAQFGIRRFAAVRIKVLSDQEKHDNAAAFVEFSLRSQYLSQGELFLLGDALRGRPVIMARSISIAGIELKVDEIHSAKLKGVTSCGIVDHQTKFVFRSSSACVIWLIQLSKEMWDFCDDGDLIQERLFHDFLPTLLDRWTALKAKHSLTVVLFSRTVMNGTPTPEAVPPEVVNSFSDDRLYYDTYHVSLDNVSRPDNWRSVLAQLQADVDAFPSRAKWAVDFSTTESKSLVCGLPSEAQEGNALEAINLALNVIDMQYVDRDLRRMGQNIVLFTGGPVVYEVDRALSKLTKDRMTDLAIGCDVVSLARAPLHISPLLIFVSSSQSEIPQSNISAQSRQSTQQSPGGSRSWKVRTSEMLDPSNPTTGSFRLDSVNAGESPASPFNPFEHVHPQHYHVPYWMNVCFPFHDDEVQAYEAASRTVARFQGIPATKKLTPFYPLPEYRMYSIPAPAKSSMPTALLAPLEKVAAAQSIDSSIEQVNVQSTNHIWAMERKVPSRNEMRPWYPLVHASDLDKALSPIGTTSSTLKAGRTSRASREILPTSRSSTTSLKPITASTSSTGVSFSKPLVSDTLASSVHHVENELDAGEKDGSASTLLRAAEPEVGVQSSIRLPRSQKSRVESSPSIVALQVLSGSGALPKIGVSWIRGDTNNVTEASIQRTLPPLSLLATLQKSHSSSGSRREEAGNTDGSGFVGSVAEHPFSDVSESKPQRRVMVPSSSLTWDSSSMNSPRINSAVGANAGTNIGAASVGQLSHSLIPRDASLEVQRKHDAQVFVAQRSASSSFSKHVPMENASSVGSLATFKNSRSANVASSALHSQRSLLQTSMALSQRTASHFHSSVDFTAMDPPSSGASSLRSSPRLSSAFSRPRNQVPSSSLASSGNVPDSPLAGFGSSFPSNAEGGDWSSDSDEDGEKSTESVRRGSRRDSVRKSGELASSLANRSNLGASFTSLSSMSGSYAGPNNRMLLPGGSLSSTSFTRVPPSSSALTSPMLMAYPQSVSSFPRSPSMTSVRGTSNPTRSETIVVAAAAAAIAASNPPMTPLPASTADVNPFKLEQLHGDNAAYSSYGRARWSHLIPQEPHPQLRQNAGEQSTPRTTVSSPVTRSGQQGVDGPWTLHDYQPNWKSLQTPAMMPFTTSFAPPAHTLLQEYFLRSYVLEMVGQRYESIDQAVQELISQRLTADFQLYEANTSLAENASPNVARERSYVLTVGKLVHFLFHDSARQRVDVRLYGKRLEFTSTVRRHSYLLWDSALEKVRPVEIRASSWSSDAASGATDWNFVDNVVFGESLEDLPGRPTRHNRVSFCMSPVGMNEGALDAWLVAVEGLVRGPEQGTRQQSRPNVILDVEGVPFRHVHPSGSLTWEIPLSSSDSLRTVEWAYIQMDDTVYIGKQMFHFQIQWFVASGSKIESLVENLCSQALSLGLQVMQVPEHCRLPSGAQHPWNQPRHVPRKSSTIVSSQVVAGRLLALDDDLLPDSVLGEIVVLSTSGGELFLRIGNDGVDLAENSFLSQDVLKGIVQHCFAVVDKALEEEDSVQ